MTIVHFGHGWLHIYCMHKSPIQLRTRLLPGLRFSPGLSGRLIRMAFLILMREHDGQNTQKRRTSSGLPLLHGRHEPIRSEAGKKMLRMKAAVMTMRLMSRALQFAERGWYVFPLRPGDKRPLPGFTKWEKRATTDRDQVIRWWSEAPYNIGIATGPSGLLVIDCDTPRGGDPPQWRLLGDGVESQGTDCQEPSRFGPQAEACICTSLRRINLLATRQAGWERRRYPGYWRLRRWSGIRFSGRFYVVVIVVL